MIEKGICYATKILDGDTDPTKVFTYTSGDYFGELALIKDEPRAASVYA